MVPQYLIGMKTVYLDELYELDKLYHCHHHTSKFSYRSKNPLDENLQHQHLEALELRWYNRSQDLHR